MKNKSIYIPGDLVMTNGKPIGTKKDIAYIITASDPNRTLTLKDGTVNKGVVTLDAITEEDRAHFVETSTWVKHIVPIPLTTKILAKNQWWADGPMENQAQCPHSRSLSLFVYSKYGEYIYSPTYGKEVLGITIRYVHQLQHLLFGLGLPMDLKV